MGLLRSLKNLLGAAADTPSPTPARPASASPEPEEIRVSEISPAELMAARQDGAAPVVLDCREIWERKQAYMPGSLHIPMNQTPARLSELDPNRDIVVVCAHGNRSYGVAAYLIEHGFRAKNLTGGMAAWQARGGDVERGHL